MRNRVRIFLACMALLFPAIFYGQDSTHVITVRDITPRQSFLPKLKGELTFAPHYSVETGAGILFSYITKANISVVGDISTRGHALLGVVGSHSVAAGKWSISYKGYFAASSLDFWGVGYENAQNDINWGIYDRKRGFVQMEVLRHFTRHFHVGPSVSWDWARWDNLEDSRTSALGYGAVAVYDTRSEVAAPQSGIFFKARQRNYADFLGKPFYISLMQFDAYCPVWDGGVMAFDLYGEFAYGDVPWTMLPTVGGTERMRGYYKGRYMDNNAVSAQVELRQHLWETIGCAVWAGAANVWGRASAFEMSHTLPNAGVGLRIKIAGGTLLRLDYGFGKNGQNGFVFGLNEAF